MITLIPHFRCSFSRSKKWKNLASGSFEYILAILQDLWSVWTSWAHLICFPSFLAWWVRLRDLYCTRIQICRSGSKWRSHCPVFLLFCYMISTASLSIPNSSFLFFFSLFFGAGEEIVHPRPNKAGKHLDPKGRLLASAVSQRRGAAECRLIIAGSPGLLACLLTF